MLYIVLLLARIFVFNLANIAFFVVFIESICFFFVLLKILLDLFRIVFEEVGYCIKVNIYISHVISRILCIYIIVNNSEC